MSFVDDFLSGAGDVLSPVGQTAASEWQGWVAPTVVGVVILGIVAVASWSTRRGGREWRSPGRRTGVMIGWSSLVAVSVVTALVLLAAIVKIAWGVLIS